MLPISVCIIARNEERHIEECLKALKPYHKEHEGMEMDEHFGIGLHICREFCKKHGGTLDVANSIRGGAVVTASFTCRAYYLHR